MQFLRPLAGKRLGNGRTLNAHRSVKLFCATHPNSATLDQIYHG